MKMNTQDETTHKAQLRGILFDAIDEAIIQRTRHNEGRVLHIEVTLLDGQNYAADLHQSEVRPIHIM
jgi:hypothetical protein